MVKLVVSHPGGPAPQLELSTSPCQTQSRRQARGPVTPELPFFACTGPPYGCENRQGHQLRAHLPAPRPGPFCMVKFLGPAGMENHRAVHPGRAGLTLLAPPGSPLSLLLSSPSPSSLPITYLSFPSESDQLWLHTSSVPGPGRALKTQR